MKKTLLISTAFFLSVSLFAQTTVNNNEAIKGKSGIQHDNAGTQVNSSANASSATTIHNDVGQNAKNSSANLVKEDKQAAVDQRQAINVDAKTKDLQTAGAASQAHSTAASANSKAKLVATSSENKSLNVNSSLRGDKNLSASTDIKQVGKMKSAEKENFHANLKGENRSQVAVENKATNTANKINASAAAQVNTAASAAHSLRVKPVSVNAGAHVNTTAGIRLR
jgi:hypothetical protein